MNRNRFIYFTDLMLVPVFILSFYTGVELHIAGQGVDHESWHIWAIFHTNASLLFMILGIIHVKSHWAWYKYGAQNETYIEGWEKKASNLLIYKRLYKI